MNNKTHKLKESYFIIFLIEKNHTLTIIFLMEEIHFFLEFRSIQIRVLDEKLAACFAKISHFACNFT